MVLKRTWGRAIDPLNGAKIGMSQKKFEMGVKFGLPLRRHGRDLQPDVEAETGECVHAQQSTAQADLNVTFNVGRLAAEIGSGFFIQAQVEARAPIAEQVHHAVLET